MRSACEGTVLVGVMKALEVPPCKGYSPEGARC